MNNDQNVFDFRTMQNIYNPNVIGTLQFTKPNRKPPEDDTIPSRFRRWGRRIQNQL